MAWFLLAAHRKRVEEGAKSRELLGKKEPEFDDLETGRSGTFSGSPYYKSWESLLWREHQGTTVHTVNHFSGNADSLDWRGERWRQNEKGCQASGILLAGKEQESYQGKGRRTTFLVLEDRPPPQDKGGCATVVGPKDRALSQRMLFFSIKI